MGCFLGAQSGVSLINQLNSGPEFKVSGLVSLQMDINSISGIERRRDPFNYRINSSLAVESYGWKTSINFNIADGRKLYGLDLPDVRIPSYALIGISPSYRWATFHLGYRSMHFSDYTLAGHSFSGAGIELKPGNMRFAGFIGKLRRASAVELSMRQSIDPIYSRKGWGFNLGYDDGKDNISLILFAAHDDITSISRNEDVSPLDNAIIGLKGNKAIGNIMELSIDYALSAVSRDSESPKLDNSGEIGVINRAFGVFTPRISSGYHRAFKTKLKFKTGFGNISLQHERVDPGYKSLGALFFNNDFENITAGAQIGLLEKQLLLNTNIGFRRNNLSGDENNTFSSLVGSINAMYRPSDDWSFNLLYSNFNTTNILRTTTIPIIQEDSLSLSLVNQNVSFSFNHISGEKKNNIITGMIAYQNSNSIQNDEVLENQTNDNIMAHLNFSKIIIDKNLKLTAGLLMNKNVNVINDLLTISPSLGIGKTFLDKKLDINSSLSWVNIYSDNTFLNRIVQPRILINYRIDKKYMVSIRSAFSSRSGNNTITSPFSEFFTSVKWNMRL